MESEILLAYNNYKEKLAEFVNKLKSQTKAESSINNVCISLGITRNMYYQRLNYPQNIPLEEVETVAQLLSDNSIVNLYQEANSLGNQLAITITENLKKAEITVTFICKKLGVDTSNFYRKQKDPRLWNQAEIEKITQVVETMKML